ncbi:MAG TPA: aldo/keto reductase [Gammaproteobacteria bacterium]
MRTALFGSKRIDVPVVGQGTWNLERADEKTAVAALQAGIAAGMTHIDTAELYGGGRAERIVARAIAGRRDEVFVVSKVLPSNAAYEDTLHACERTLERLGTDYLDVYLLHWRGDVPLAETFRAFETLERTGKIKAYGVSNFDVDDLEEALAITGEGRIACNQVLYHLLERSIEYALIPWCRNHDVAVVAYSPFGSGSFPALQRGGGQALAEIATQRSLSAHQVALAFLIKQGNVFAIPKAGSVGHVLKNAAAGDVELSAAEMHALDAAFPAKRRRRLAMI